MADKDVGKSLLRLDPAGPDVRQLAQKAIHRDRWKVRLLTALTLILWLVAAAGVFLVLFIAVVYLYPRQRKIAHDLAIIPVEKLALAQSDHQEALEICTDIVTASFIALTLAALCTVWLVLSTRRATLREVNARLAEISEQLRHLQTLQTTGASAPPGN